MIFLQLLLTINFVMGWVVWGFVTYHQDEYTDEQEDIKFAKRCLIFFGIFLTYIIVTAREDLKNTEYYKRNGYLIPTKANRTKKLLRILSE